MKHHKIIITLALLLLALPIRSAITGQWVKHPTFDNSTLKVIDTPTRTYFAGYNQIYDPVITVKASPDMTLFYYDKEGDEIVPALRTSSLSGSAIRSLEYNFKKNYLVILYDNYDIDLLYDNGNVVNIPALRYADIPGSKNVNSISFDFANNGIWLATDFGYVILNDEKYEVEDSRNYGVHLNSAVRLLDKVYLSTGTKTYSAPAADRRATLSDYTVLEDYPGVAWMKPVSDRKMVINSPEGGVNYVKYLEALPEDEGFNVLGDHRFDGPVFLSPTKNGLMLVIWGTAVLYDGDRDYVHSQMRPAADSDAGYFITGSWDFKEFFTAVPRLGLRSHKETADGYTLTRDWMRPNAPNAFLSRGMAYHPEYGMLVNSHGVERVFTGTNLNAFNEPILLSALKNGIWTPMAPAYTNPLQTETGYGPLGIAIEPSDSKYVWSGSNFSGITRLNLEDPQDILHYSFANDPTSSLPGYVESAPVMAWGRICQYSAPVFDNNRTLWTCFYNYDNTANVELRYLTEADRKASTGAASARPWRELIIKDVPADQFAVFTPLNSTVNKGLMAYLTQNRIMIYDTNQTPDNTSDDKKSVITSFRDQDGGDVSLYGVNCVYEDPATGNLWFGTSSGIYYIQPRSIMKGQQTINRIKVSRQDGTSQADYLLNGVGVNAITPDAQGRKWFATAGAGIVVTSADGKEVMDEITTENSEIPSDYLYNICYNPDSRSMMVSTDKGLAELFINGTADSAGADEQVRAYPNPVHPDYHGWVTIDGLPDNSFVKIVDAAGNLVRELGRAEAGAIQWDVLNLHHNRVHTGVYYVLISPASGSGESNVAKILVMN